MTNTSTADIAATTQQVMQLANAGSELVRITVNDADAAAAVAHIREKLDENSCLVRVPATQQRRVRELQTVRIDMTSELGRPPPTEEPSRRLSHNAPKLER